MKLVNTINLQMLIKQMLIFCNMKTNAFSISQKESLQKENESKLDWFDVISGKSAKLSTES